MSGGAGREAAGSVRSIGWFGALFVYGGFVSNSLF